MFGPTASGWSVQPLHNIWFRSPTLLGPPPRISPLWASPVAIQGSLGGKCDLPTQDATQDAKKSDVTEIAPQGQMRKRPGKAPDRQSGGKKNLH